VRTRELLSAVRPLRVEGPLPEEVGSVVGDSRRVRPGDVFVAIRGLVDDGHRYVAEARRRGAALVVGEDASALAGGPHCVVDSSRTALGHLAARAAGDPSQHLRVIGVTGTNGKTTTTHLVGAALGAAGVPCGVIGTVGVAFAGRYRPVSHTTPAADELQAALRDLAAEGARAVAMEVSSHALDLDRHVGTRFTGAVFTNLTQDHLDYHGTLERYRQAKLKLFSALADGARDGAWAAINADDAHSAAFVAAARAAGARVLTYGLRDGEVRAEDLDLHAAGAAFVVRTPAAALPVRLRLRGRFNVLNALAALTAATAEGLALERCIAGVESVSHVPGRFEAVDRGQPFQVVVDYAHTPDGLRNVLETAREIARGRVLVVFGAGGDRDRGKRPQMGEVAARLADYAFLTSDNPRSEDPEAILDAIEAGFRAAGGRGERHVGRREAIRAALAAARPGDLVLIAGKGHETTQTIGTAVLPFDDRQVAAEELAALAPW
jgi:UDP-N-acetylmuramoyl-L-alanyl-D-glutamate--2,6-diaminopimelate ligase